MSNKTDSQAGEKGKFQPVSHKQSQDLPGLERDMKPTSESTALEGEDSFVEYAAAGKLKGKKAIITGGDSGIGRAVAVLFAREGADISIVYLPEEQPDAEDTKKMVEKEGKQCLLIPGDLMENKTCQDAVSKHVEKYGEVNILVNNASKQIKCPDFADIDLDNVESTFRSNILQMFAMTKYSVPHMPKGSTIINTASTAPLSPSRTLAQNLLQRGIRVNAVAPGPVHTPLQPASRSAEEMEEFGHKSKLGRIGQPSEIAPSFVFLASKDSELYYGQVLKAFPVGD
ncbi:unnamed protein product [Parascedosporium putredinis]|uniref:Oxidoreductase n=1 Tax=Parascedosporium putredinis TaxID=1442378 RepID=A0A9P1MBH9_9PEZI|nr:unnamed protein product [Parascedosporium putredinis]CAI7994839.1 unnamed protein product [Parascedosporium putredinis]